MKVPEYFYFRVKANKTEITLEDASDVDVAEVVRCCHCTHYSGTEQYCQFWHDATLPDAYCSYAKDIMPGDVI